MLEHLGKINTDEFLDRLRLYAPLNTKIKNKSFWRRYSNQVLFSIYRLELWKQLFNGRSNACTFSVHSMILRRYCFKCKINLTHMLTPFAITQRFAFVFLAKAREYVFTGVGLCVCLWTTITKKIVDGFVPNFMGRFLGERKGKTKFVFRYDRHMDVEVTVKFYRWLTIYHTIRLNFFKIISLYL